jgi:glycosyltransferase involved in cell wall biosynthesis
VGDPRGLRFAIVLQTPKDPHSAVYRSYQQLGDALQRAGHSLEIVAPADFPSIRRVAGRWVTLLYPLAVAAWMRRRRADFDLVMFQSYAGWLASGLRLRRVPPVVVMFHGVEPLYHRELRAEADVDGHPLSIRYRLLQEALMPLMLRVACGTAQGVVCLNQEEAAFLHARAGRSSRGPVVLPHGVAAGFFAPRRRLDTVRTLLFVGQWLPMKGVRYLREACVTLLGRHSDARLICAGTLTAADTVLEAFPAEIRARVTVFPRVDSKDLARLYLEADAFVFPSLYEGFSMALLEAMAAGVPIVTTEVGIAADTLRHEESALIVPKRSAAALVEAVERLQADPGLATRLGAAASAAAKNYRQDAVERRIIGFLVERAAAGVDQYPRG